MSNDDWEVVRDRIRDGDFKSPPKPYQALVQDLFDLIDSSIKEDEKVVPRANTEACDESFFEGKK